MCTRTLTQEQKQFLDLNIYIYCGLISKSAPLASLNYAIQIYNILLSHTNVLKLKNATLVEATSG